MAGRVEGADAVHTSARADDGGAVRDSDVRGSGIGDAEELSSVGDEALGGAAVDHGYLLVSVVVDEDGSGSGGVVARRACRCGVVLALRERGRGVGSGGGGRREREKEPKRQRHREPERHRETGTAIDTDRHQAQT